MCEALGMFQCSYPGCGVGEAMWYLLGEAAFCLTDKNVFTSDQWRQGFTEVGLVFCTGDGIEK